ncbi:MAG: hypothetical protein CMB97_01405 [Flavobacteriaceae bacterium]|nr:hypothetical protein [Flavobacteriaceae bacterium]
MNYKNIPSYNTIIQRKKLRNVAFACADFAGASFSVLGFYFLFEFGNLLFFFYIVIKGIPKKTSSKYRESNQKLFVFTLGSLHRFFILWLWGKYFLVKFPHNSWIYII